MLTRLVITNYALIDELTVSFEPGFNILTGETGAGKSIIIGALSLILGARADFATLRNPGKKCIVEGFFDLREDGFESFFRENDLDYEPVSIVRREITPGGKSRAFINDTPVNLQLVHDLSLRLIDIHSQHQNLELNTRQFQLRVVDAVALSGEALKLYQESYALYNESLKRLEALRVKAAKSLADFDYLTFQYQQLGEARLRQGEQELLEDEQNRLVHAGEIKGTLLWVSDLLAGEHFPVVPRLKEAAGKVEKIVPFLKVAGELHQRLHSAWIELNDLAYEAGLLSDKTEDNTQRLGEVSARLDLIYSLEQKHHLKGVDALLAFQEDLKSRISEIAGYDEEIATLEKEVLQMKIRRNNAASELTAMRKKALPVIEEKVTHVLRQLAIPHARFIVEREDSADYTLSGADHIQFLFSANRDMEPAEIGKIASGGEISRVMLALKTLVTGSNRVSTILFDEIDSGISGGTALKMGQILRKLSADVQVINITHLPQIAGMGDHHFLVYKEEQPSGTYTSIRKLNHMERVEELARMVGGDHPSEAAQKTAGEMVFLGLKD